MAKRDKRSKMHYVPDVDDGQVCKATTWAQWTTDELGKVDCRACLMKRLRSLRRRRHDLAQPHTRDPYNKDRRACDREIAAVVDRMCALGIEVSDPKGGA